MVVTGASVKHLLAMKIDAGRPEDIEDIQWLLEQLQIENLEKAIEVHRETYPHSQLLTTSRKRLEEAFSRKDMKPGGDENVAPPPPRPPKVKAKAADPERSRPKTR